MARPLDRMWRIGSTSEGALSEADVSWHEEPAAALAEGEVLVQTSHVVVDPILSAALLPTNASNVMPGAALGTVIESRDPTLAVGTKVSGLFGWKSHARVPAASVFVHSPTATFSDDDYLGALNYLGATAFLAVREVALVSSGDTVVVTAGASAIGSIAGQLAKREGARVIGVGTTPEQCAWMTGELGFDVAIDRRAEDLGPALARSCPDGMDVCIDGLGGPVLDACLGRLAMRGRVVLFGAATSVRSAGPTNFSAITARRATVQGLLFLDYPLQLEAAIEALGELVSAGKLKYRLDVVDGLDKAPAAMGRVKTEGTTAIVRIAG